MAKILVVDDSQMVRKKLRSALEKGGHTVVEGIDGVDGLAKLEEYDGIQLIVADVNMPNMNGVDMCLKMRENKKFDTIKIFMLTAESSPEMKAKTANANISAWILKPYDIDKVLSAIDKVLSR